MLRCTWRAEEREYTRRRGPRAGSPSRRICLIFAPSTRIAAIGSSKVCRTLTWIPRMLENPQIHPRGERMAHQSSPPRPRRLRTGDRSGAGRRLVIGAVVLALSLGALAGAAGAREGGHAAAPAKGGTLKLLGTSDIFNLDTVSAYYTVSSLLERAFTRQLVSYPNAPTFPASIKIVPDIATAVPTKGNGHQRGRQDLHVQAARGRASGTRRPPSGDRGRFRARVQDALQPGVAERRARGTSRARSSA